MDWVTISLLAAICVGLASAVALMVILYLNNPTRVARLGSALVVIAIKTGLHYLPFVLGYLTKRMDPETERRWRECERRGGKWDHHKKVCK